MTSISLYWAQYVASYTNQFNILLIYNNGTVEDEEHIHFHCNFYYGERQDFYSYMKNNIPNFNNLSIEQKLQTVMTEEYV